AAPAPGCQKRPKTRVAIQQHRGGRFVIMPPYHGQAAADRARTEHPTEIIAQVSKGPRRAARKHDVTGEARLTQHPGPMCQTGFLQARLTARFEGAVSEQCHMCRSEPDHYIDRSDGIPRAHLNIGAVLCLGVYTHPMPPTAVAHQLTINGARHTHLTIPIHITAAGRMLRGIENGGVVRMPRIQDMFEPPAHNACQRVPAALARRYGAGGGFQQIETDIEAIYDVGALQGDTAAAQLSGDG